MPEWLNRLYQDLSNLWGKLPAAQKWLIGGIAAAAVAIVVAILVGLVLFPASHQFMDNLTPYRLGEATSFLDEKGVNYRVGKDGKSVFIFEDPSRLRVEYFTESRAKTIGGNRFLLGQNLTQTKEQFNELKLRAQQEELELTLVRGSGNIIDARVHLTPGQKGLFRRDETKPTASIKLVTEDRGVTREQVEGIQYLVAHSLPDLQPGDVKVMDQDHRVLDGFKETSETERITTEKLAAERSFEEKLEKALGRHLDDAVGPSNYNISVIAKLDYDKLEIAETHIDTENPFITHKTTEESQEESGEAGGPPGTPSNNPADTIGQGSGSSQTSSFTSESSEVDYRPRIEKTLTKQVAPGAIVSQFVAVSINEKQVLEDGDLVYQPRTGEEKGKLAEQLKATVGHNDASAEYQFILTEYRFDTTGRELEEVKIRHETFWRAAEDIAFLLISITLVVAFLFVLRRVFTPIPAEEAEEMEELEAERREFSMADLGLRPIGEEEQLDPDRKRAKIIREQVENYARENPEEVAMVLKNWLSE